MKIQPMLLAMALAIACTTGSAGESPYPAKPIRFIIAVPPGGSTDTLSRLVGQRLANSLGQQVVIDNRPGAHGLIGIETGAKSAPDGYTLVGGGTASMAINQSLYQKLPYDPVKQFDPVVMIAYSSSVLIVHPSIPAKNIGELAVHAKAKPGELKYASAGVGSSPHLSGEVFRTMTGADVLHVPYAGAAQGVIGIANGESSIMFTGVASALAQIKAGRVRALSVNGPKRSPALPDVPTAGESGLPGFEVDFWIGIFVPTGTPRTIINRLNSEVVRIMSVPDVREKIISLGADPVGGTPEQFATTMRRDIERWARTVKAAGLKAQ